MKNEIESLRGRLNQVDLLSYDEEGGRLKVGEKVLYDFHQKLKLKSDEIIKAYELTRGKNYVLVIERSADVDIEWLESDLEHKLGIHVKILMSNFIDGVHFADLAEEVKVKKTICPKCKSIMIPRPYTDRDWGYFYWCGCGYVDDETQSHIKFKEEMLRDRWELVNKIN